MCGDKMIDKPLKSWDTTVPISRSQEAIRNILVRFGVTRVVFEDDIQTGNQVIRFDYPTSSAPQPVPVVFNIQIKGIHKWLSDWKKAWPEERVMRQAKKVVWRHIHDWVKVNVNLVEFGLIPFENMFLSYFAFTLPDGTMQTFGEHVLPKLLAGKFKLIPEGK